MVMVAKVNCALQNFSFNRSTLSGDLVLKNACSTFNVPNAKVPGILEDLTVELKDVKLSRYSSDCFSLMPDCLVRCGMIRWLISSVSLRF